MRSSTDVCGCDAAIMTGEIRPTRVPISGVTVEAYLRHAELYGTECVYSVAQRDRTLTCLDLVILKLKLATIAKEHKARKRASSWTEDVPPVNDLDIVALRKDGLSIEEIATRTGWSIDRVSKAVTSTKLVAVEEPVYAGSIIEVSEDETL